jgi:hypothetical protein
LVSRFNATVKVCVTAAAEAKVELPAWLAVMEQRPAPSRLAELPLTEHTVGELEEKETGSPELAVAESVKGKPPMACSEGVGKVMVCDVVSNGAAAVCLATLVDSDIVRPEHKLQSSLECMPGAVAISEESRVVDPHNARRMQGKRKIVRFIGLCSGTNRRQPTNANDFQRPHCGNPSISIAAKNAWISNTADSRTH